MGKAVEMRAIEKSFGANNVLKAVDFSVDEGSVHALLGENGAGKSTLMNILAGVITKDAGTIIVDSKKVAFIHQELSLVNDLCVFENLFLGHELKAGPLLDKKQMIQKSEEILTRMGIDMKPTTLVAELNPSYKQVVEIARALLKDASVIIMDEPTASLTDVEIEKIFAVMKTLREQGVSLIFISHKLNEVIEICDSYTVLRDGEVVSCGTVDANTTERELSAHMVGKEVSGDDIYQSREVGEMILEIQNLSKGREFKDVNIHLRRGEILGVTGLLGDGRTELFASVYGANWPYQGEVLIEGKPVKMKTVGIAQKNRLAYVPKNRKENGIIKDLSIEENAVLPIMSKLSIGGIIREKKQNEIVKDYVEMLGIKVSDVRNLITSLSGGNQQKVVLSKALCTDPKILILDNPTQGVDIGAKMEIYRQIITLAEAGFSFIILSNEFPELHKTCDRVYVMFEGEVRHEFTRDEMTEENIMLVATGGKVDADCVASCKGA